MHTNTGANVKASGRTHASRAPVSAESGNVLVFKCACVCVASTYMVVWLSKLMCNRRNTRAR